MASPVQQIITTQSLPAAEAALYTSSALGVYTQVTALNCCNTDTGAHAVTIALVPSGQSYGNATITTKARAILPGENYNGANEYGMVLNPGDSLVAFADSANVVNIFASGLVLTG